MAKLPRISSNVSPDLRQYGDRVREAFKDVEDRANALEKTLADLLQDQSSINSGMASMSGAISQIYNENWETPHAPLNVVVTGAFSTNIIEWDKPTYNGHAYSEVWAATEPDGGGTPVLGDAILVGQTPGTVFAHDLGGYGKRWYWVKFVNKADVPGPFNAVDGLLGETSQDPAYLISILSEAYGTGSEAPFFQLDAPELINGVTVPAGTYIKQGWIADASINTAKIGLAAVDTANIADLAVSSAKISEIDAGKITSGFIDTDRLNANSITAGKIDSRGLTIRDDAGNIILGSGSNLDLSFINGLGSLATQNSVDYSAVSGTKPPSDADKTSSNVAAGITGQGNFATLDQITKFNISTYIASAAIQKAYIGDAAVGTLQIEGNAVIVPSAQTLTSDVAGGQPNQLVQSLSVTLNQSGYITVLFSAKHGYAGLWQVDGESHQFDIRLNDSSKITRGGILAIDYPNISWSGAVSSGTHTVEVYWYGSSKMTLHKRTLVILGSKR